MAAVPYSTLRGVARARISFITRQTVEGHIDRMIALLDRLDVDADFERDDDNEPQGDEEPSLGWLLWADQERFAADAIQYGKLGLEYDLEWNVEDEGEAVNEDGGDSLDEAHDGEEGV